MRRVMKFTWEINRTRRFFPSEQHASQHGDVILPTTGTNSPDDRQHNSDFPVYALRENPEQAGKYLERSPENSNGLQTYNNAVRSGYHLE